jgi:hypothetical protein
VAARTGLATWPAPNGRHHACRVTDRGNRGISSSLFPQGGSWACLSSACVPARWPDRPILACAAATRAGWCVAAVRWGKGEGGREKGAADRPTPSVSG